MIVLSARANAASRAATDPDATLSALAEHRHDLTAVAVVTVGALADAAERARLEEGHG